MKIDFENTATFITAFDDQGDVVIRCNFKYTDCREDESLDAFVNRHGGAERTAEYLKEAYRTQGEPAC